MSLLMDALRRAEARSPGDPAASDETPAPSVEAPATLPEAGTGAPAPDSGPDLEALSLEPLQIDPEALLSEAPLPEEEAQPVQETPTDQRQQAKPAALAVPRRSVWSRNGFIYLLSGLISVLAVVGGYYAWRSQQVLTPEVAHSATLIDAPVDAPLPEYAAEADVPAAPGAESGRDNAVAAVPANAPVRHPDATPGRAAESVAPGVGGTAESDAPARAGRPDPGYRIEIHRSRGSAGVDPLVQRAYQAYQEQDYARAGQLYRQALQRKPGNRDALLGSAAVALHQGHDEVARYYYQVLLKKNPADTSARLALQALSANQDDLAQGSAIKHLLPEDQGNAQLHFALGNHYAQSAQWKEAQQAYFEALRIEPGQADYAFNLAVSLDRLGLYAQALDYYRQARQLGEGGAALFSRPQLDRRVQQLEAHLGSRS